MSMMWLYLISGWSQSAKEHSWTHAYVDHEEGEYVRYQRLRGKVREVSTQRIDGQWGNFKTWCKAKYGAMPDNVWTVLKEWQWRHYHRGKTCFCCL